jgi:hypothetical protein
MKNCEAALYWAAPAEATDSSPEVEDSAAMAAYRDFALPCQAQAGALPAFAGSDAGHSGSLGMGDNGAQGFRRQNAARKDPDHLGRIIQNQHPLVF